MNGQTAHFLLTVALPALCVLVLVACVAFFAGSETAYLSITDIKLRQLLKEDTSGKKNSPVQRVARLKQDVNKLLSLVLIGINFVTSLASGLAATVAINLVGAQGATYATVVMSFILIIFGEIVPKTVAAVHPVAVAEKHSRPLLLLQLLFMPIVWFFSKLTVGITSFIMLFWKQKKQPLTEAELKSLIDVGADEGTLETSEKKMLYNIFEFTDLHIRDIMCHRSRVRFIPIDATYDEVVQLFTDARHSWLPVCSESFDNVLGMVYYKTVLLRGKQKNDREHTFVRRCMRPALFVPETLTAMELLHKFKKEHMSFAIAVDENGANSGIATMNDILSAVFGRGVNEFLGGEDEEQPAQRIRELTATEFLVPGDIRLNELNEFFELNLASEDYDTLAGWLMERFDALPEAGEMLTHDGVLYTIEEQSQRHIQTVKLRLPKAFEDTD